MLPLLQHLTTIFWFTEVPFYLAHHDRQWRKKLQGILKRQTTTTQFEETQQGLGSKPDLVGILELSDWDFKTIMIDMLRDLMDKVDSMWTQMRSISEGMEILGKKTNKNAGDQKC